MTAALAAPAPQLADDFAVCRRSIAEHSRSFAMASRLFRAERRNEVCAVYALCRRLDDAVDGATPETLPRVLTVLDAELESLFAGAPGVDPAARAFAHVARQRGIPVDYPRELAAGFAMDAGGTRYATLADLVLYAWRVAGTIGAMLCHVMGVRGDGALPRAAHLGIAMQLTNVARDVREDWERGRLYLPAALLGSAADPLDARLAAPPPRAADELTPHREAIASAIATLLAAADRYYASADHGLRALDRRSALAVATARRVYAEIGAVLRTRSCDPLAPRAVVRGRRKAALLAGALAAGLCARRARAPRPPQRVLRFEEVPLV